MANEHRILSAEAKKLGDAGENYEKFSQLTKRTKEIEEIIDFMNKEFPKGMASGGIARVGMAGGGILKEFIEKLFIKTSNDIRQGKGKWAGLNQDQMMKQHDDLTKMLKKWEMSGSKRLPEGAEQFLGMNDLQVSKAIKDATKKVKKDRVATADELEDYGDILDPTGEAYIVEEGMTVGQLDDMVKEHKAYMADMKSQYMRGDLDKYVKPEELEKQRLFRQKKIDDVLAKAYDEVFYQKPATGDYKLDADVLSDSIAEQIGKGAFDELPQTYQTQIHNTALKRVVDDLKMQRTLKDVEQKMQLSDFDVTGRKKNASGGIAGQLHLNEGGRVPMIFGGSLGLKELIKRMKGPHKRLFPGKIGVDKRKLAKTLMPREFERLQSLKIEQLENLLDAMKLDKEQMAMRASHKAMNDPGLDFMMKKLDEMPGSGLTSDADLAKYVDIDKDILTLEQMIKNKKMVGRKPNAYGGLQTLNQGGRARFANGSPLVDARMQNTYAENIAANEAQRKQNLKTRAISALGDATGYTQHNINNQLLRNALADKQINEAQYKRMGGYDVAQQMPDIFGVFGKPAGVAAASTGYNIIKSLAGLVNPDDPNAQYGDIGRVASILENTRGSTGLSPENLALYNQIISGQTSGAGTQQSELDRFKTAWDMTHYGMPSEEVNWYGTGRPNYERSLKEYQTWNQGPYSSDPSITSKMTSSFGHAPGYMLAKGGLANILGV